jgi:hypothetical protein
LVGFEVNLAFNRESLLYSKLAECITNRGIVIHMSKLIAVRIPDDVLQFIDGVKGKRSAVIIAALSSYFYRGAGRPLSPETAAAITPPMDHHAILDSLRSSIQPQARPVEVEEQDEPTLPMCAHTEYDGETGETYRCALRQHSNKIRCVKGEKV